MALAPPSAGACRTGSVILTAKLITGHGAAGERREPRPGLSRCRRCPRSGSSPETGTGPQGCPAGRTPAGGHAWVRRGGVGSPGPGRQGTGGCECPERPSPCSGADQRGHLAALIGEEGKQDRVPAPASSGRHTGLLSRTASGGGVQAARAMTMGPAGCCDERPRGWPGLAEDRS